MAKRVRNVLAVLGIAIYCIAAIICFDLPEAKYSGIIGLGLYEIGISIVYCVSNKTIDKRELRMEVIGGIVILVSIVFVLFQFVL